MSQTKWLRPVEERPAAFVEAAAMSPEKVYMLSGHQFSEDDPAGAHFFATELAGASERVQWLLRGCQPILCPATAAQSPSGWPLLAASAAEDSSAIPAAVRKKTGPKHASTWSHECISACVFAHVRSGCTQASAHPRVIDTLPGPAGGECARAVRLRIGQRGAAAHL